MKICSIGLTAVLGIWILGMSGVALGAFTVDPVPTRYGPIPEGPQTGGEFISVILGLADWLFVILLLAAVIFIVLAGFQFITGGGDPTAVAQARTKLIWAAVGIAVALLAKGAPAAISNLIGEDALSVLIGDVTQDGIIASNDALFISEYVAGTRTLTPAQLSAADVNSDNKVSTNDAFLLSLYLAGDIAGLPVAGVVGDVQQDGVITAGDSLFIAQYLAGTRTLSPFELALADVNNDGVVTNDDPLVIAQYISGVVPSLPHPEAPLP